MTADGEKEEATTVPRDASVERVIVAMLRCIRTDFDFDGSCW